MATRNFVPRATTEGSVGTASKKWGSGYFGTMYAANFTINGNEILPETDNVANCGNASLRFQEVHAASFIGTAAQATYADLAENFSCKNKNELSEGMVLSVSDLSEYDVEPCMEDLSSCVVGIVSIEPGYLMNTKMQDGTPVAIKGRVRVKIIGPVHKKDFLVSAGYGRARAGKPEELPFKIGLALETNLSENEKLVESFVG